MNTEKICSPYVEKQVRIAESLCKKHGGMLPRSGILRSTGYCHLDNYIREYPEAFAHIPQPVRKPRKTLEYYLKLVKKLCSNNDGVLPNVVCLRKQGYGALVSFMRRNSKNFVHIKQQNKAGKSLADHVLNAEKIARENGGILPRAGKLQEQGYYRIAYCVRHYPDHFKHIQIAKSARSELEEHIANAKKLSREHNGVIPNPAWLKLHGFGSLYQCMIKNKRHFAQFKVDTHRQLPDHWVAVAEKLAKQYGGVLPCLSWLKRKKHTALIQSMRAHPKLFEHITQEHKRKRISEWVVLAEQLAQQHNGVLPRHIWLRQHGYVTLSAHIQKYSQAFKNIPRYEKPDTVIQYVNLAEQLCADNNGILPHPGWLQRNGKKALYEWMRKRPNAFRHITQFSSHKNTELKYIAVALQLCKEHGGILPNPRWLSDNGHSDLYQYMKKRRDKFSHIPQKRITFVTLEEYLVRATKLAAEHGGALPNPQWLRNNGHHGLLSCMQRHKSAFKHIQQSRKVKDLNEHLKDAMQLADSNGGVLPSMKWLRDNHFYGLYVRIKKSPSHFAHLIGAYTNRSLNYWISMAEELTRENRGQLPNSVWLSNNGHERLCRYMKKYPNSFAHLISA